MKDCDNCKYRELDFWEDDPCEKCKKYDKWEPKDKFSELWEKFMEKKLVVNCRTEEEANKFLTYCDGKGLTWITKRSLKECNHWDKFKERTYYTKEVTYDNIKSIVKEDGYETVTYSEMFGEGKGMKTYKTWGIWRDAESLEDKHFKCIKSQNGVVQEGDNLKLIKFANCYGLAKKSGTYVHERVNGLTGFEEWELVQEPVSFMEAVNSKKKIKPSDEHFKEYAILDHWLDVFTWGSEDLARELINGKWFVEEAE